MTIWTILRPFGIAFWLFGIVCGHLVYFLRFGMLGPRKIWQPWFLPTVVWRRGEKLIQTIFFCRGKKTSKRPKMFASAVPLNFIENQRNRT
jgi:hypothetical protein